MIVWSSDECVWQYVSMYDNRNADANYYDNGDNDPPAAIVPPSLPEGWSMVHTNEGYVYYEASMIVGNGTHPPAPVTRHTAQLDKH